VLRRLPGVSRLACLSAHTPKRYHNLGMYRQQEHMHDKQQSFEFNVIPSVACPFAHICTSADIYSLHVYAHKCNGGMRNPKFLFSTHVTL
jgi:hypothetical protein